MSHKAKNILIFLLVLVIAFLSWMLFVKDSGKYCRTILRELPRADSAQ